MVGKNPKIIILPIYLQIDYTCAYSSSSTATTERAFSTMNIIKNRLRNMMEDDFLMDSMILYIEKEIVAKFGTESIIDDF